MSRIETVSKEKIKESAFLLAKEKGVSEVTARKLAAKIGCSTQPIFRKYENMEDLLKDVFDDSLKYFDDFYLNFEKNSPIPFVNLGLCYISFAEKEKELFTDLFMKKNPYGLNMYSLLNGRTGAVVYEMNKAKEEGCKNTEDVFMKMWILIHGAACMTVTGDYDLTQSQTRLQLESAYKAFAR